MRQELLWIPEGIDVGAYAKQCVVDYSGPEPYRLWTLYQYQDQSAPPVLPYRPVHHVNAFIEDYLHDWNIRDGKLKYASRACEGSVWVLLEFKEEA